MWHKIAVYTRRYPAKIAGYLSAIILYFNKHFPHFPIDIAIPSVMIMIGLGETAQKIERDKTIEALYTENKPDLPDSKIIDNIDGKV
jgi:uncharacterized membrane protein YoaT (DUF817 family)